jgi:hypothetical protein
MAFDETVYGSDVDCITDIDSTFRTVTGGLAVAQAYARRLQTVHASWFADRDYGFSLIERLNDSQDPRLIFEIESGMEAEAVKDPRVESADASVEFSEVEARLTATVKLILATGPFDLVFVITPENFTLLTPGITTA